MPAFMAAPYHISSLSCPVRITLTDEYGQLDADIAGWKGLGELGGLGCSGRSLVPEISLTNARPELDGLGCGLSMVCLRLDS